MQIFRGNRRLFETSITEDRSTTSTIRVIPIRGITILDEIKDCVLTVKAILPGSANTTYIQINNLPKVELKLFYGNDIPKAPTHPWIRVGQVYNLIYTGEYFTVVGTSSDITKSDYNFNFLNNTPVTGMDLSNYLTKPDFEAIKIGDTMSVYYDVKAANIHSSILSTIEWTNTYAVGKSCRVKTLAFLDYACDPVSIDICLGTDNNIYYGTIPGYDI